jgi:hypothetical protein
MWELYEPDVPANVRDVVFVSLPVTWISTLLDQSAEVARYAMTSSRAWYHTGLVVSRETVPG